MDEENYMESTNYTEPTGYKEVKKGGSVLYKYVFGKGEGTRFTNTNKRCGKCPQVKKCYVGRHSIVIACPAGRKDLG